jgi:hypothetical protein
MSIFTNPASSSPEQTAAYIDALLELLGDRDPLDVLRSTPTELGAGVAGLPADLVTRPEAEGKWSIRHVLQHLVDSEIVWAYRMRMVLAQDRPALTGYDQDLWAERLGYDEANAGRALEQFGVLRQGNIWLLDRASPDDLRRVGVHTERGDESVERMMRLYAGHDLLHLRQIGRIRRAVARPAE